MRYLLLILFFLCAPAYSATIEVPKDYVRIQDAIDGAKDHDVILVDAGTYNENLKIHQKTLTIMSKLGINTTVIDGQKKDRVVAFFGKKSAFCHLQGFTITNGAARYGAGILCQGPMNIKNNRITQNYGLTNNGDAFGIGIACYGPEATIQLNEITNNFPMPKGFCSGGGVWTSPLSKVKILNNEISHNKAGDGWGAGIRCQGAAVIAGNNIHHNSDCNRGGGVSCNSDKPILISDNLIHHNTAIYQGGGVFFWGQENHWIRNCLVVFNTAGTYGGGIYSTSNLKISNCTFYGNQAQGGEGGGLCLAAQECLVENCILWENLAVTNNEIAGNGIKVEFSDVKGGYPGNGNLDADPLFFNPGLMGFHLKQDPHQPGIINPCVDAGNNLALNAGLRCGATASTGAWDKGVVDMGFHYAYGLTLEGLTTRDYQLSERLGGQIEFNFHAGYENFHRNYLLLGSASGVTPGVTLPGGVVLPINWDNFTTLILGLTNSPLCQNFMGLLDEHGMGQAYIEAPPLPNLAGIILHFAYALNSPWDFASNPVQIRILP